MRRFINHPRVKTGTTVYVIIIIKVEDNTKCQTHLSARSPESHFSSFTFFTSTERVLSRFIKWLSCREVDGMDWSVSTFVDETPYSIRKQIISMAGRAGRYLF